MVERFRTILAGAKRDGPWSTLSEAQLDDVATQLDAADVAEIIDALDQLSREKAAVPDWDGDTQDDIAQAQETFARILSRMKGEHRGLIEAGLTAREPLTRVYLALALD